MDGPDIPNNNAPAPFVPPVVPFYPPDGVVDVEPGSPIFAPFSPEDGVDESLSPMNDVDTDSSDDGQQIPNQNNHSDDNSRLNVKSNLGTPAANSPRTAGSNQHRTTCSSLTESSTDPSQNSSMTGNVLSSLITPETEPRSTQSKRDQNLELSNKLHSNGASSAATSSKQLCAVGIKELLLKEDCECCIHLDYSTCPSFLYGRPCQNPAPCPDCGLVGADCDCAQSSSSDSDLSSDRMSFGRSKSYDETMQRPATLCDKLWMKRKSEVEAAKDLLHYGKKPRCEGELARSRGRGSAHGRHWLQRIPSRANPPPQMAGWLQTFQDWSNAERLLALDEMIELCEPTQVRHLMAVIEPQFQRDFISLLPKELALYVLSFLEPRDLLQAAQTCRYWRILAEDNLLWREKCREESIDEALVFGSRARRKLTVDLGPSPWKFMYMRQHEIEENWRSTPIRTPKMLKGHDDHVITCLEFCGNKIVSGSDDNTIKVWSASGGKCLRTLVGHTGGVWSSQMVDNLIISGSTDRTLRVWDAESGRCIHTLYGHSSTVRCMHLHDKIVVSGSRDATLRMWHVETGECLHVLVGHVAAVRCVQYDGRRVVSGAYDFMVKVWDPETEACLHTLQGHTNRVYSLQFDGVHIVSGSLDTSIRVWDVENGNCLHTLIGHQSLTSGMELQDNILVSGNADSTVKVWNITTGQCLQTLQGPSKHQSAVTCLQFNKKFVITSSDDGTVKLWSLKTGEFLRNLVSLDSGGSGGVVWRVRCCNTKLVCAVGSRNGTEETKLLVLDFDVLDDAANDSLEASNKWSNQNPTSPLQPVTSS